MYPHMLIFFHVFRRNTPFRLIDHRSIFSLGRKSVLRSINIVLLSIQCTLISVTWTLRHNIEPSIPST
jgi:hypothetical protein